MPAHRIPEANLAELPAACGVYVFHGEGALPLYIGKSVNIRSRVLAHLREPAEARMLAQACRVSWQRTAGEVGALLLESRWVKERQPLFNKRLRRSRSLCAWTLASSAPVLRLVHSRDQEFARRPDLFGLYTSTHAAQQALRKLAEDECLCLARLGLESASPRGCFARQLGRCALCTGQEAAPQHDERLQSALHQWQVQAWPFEGPVGLVERDGDWIQTHVLQHWAHLGTVEGCQLQLPPGHRPPPFDLDGYRILVRPLLGDQAELLLAAASASAS
ncbi:endonuclease [Roseateles sp. DB2]|uniref:endonuclease n=1 Tax=Roseateles sp. DB2 TaxID=3453717 RepID=UPI003EEEB720